jgi:CRP-like cAMP-binding protein
MSLPGKGVRSVIVCRRNRAQTAGRPSVLLPHWERAMAKSLSRGPNRVLSRMSRADFALLQPHLQPLDLPAMMQLETGAQRIGAIYFIERGFASVVADGPGKRNIDIGLIGREGMTGLPVVLGQDRARHTAYMQVAGSGQRISTARLRRAIAHSVSLHQSLLQCVHAFLIQTAETALANGRSKNEQRLARWLLMTDDRLDGHELPLTHKLLAIMLGVQRPNVTAAIKALERAGLIQAGRRVITILDRKGLVKFSKGAYVAPEEAG